MRLTKSQIQFLGYRITDDLQVAGYIDPEDPNALMDAIVERCRFPGLGRHQKNALAERKDELKH